jgi:hypothetical protein
MATLGPRLNREVSYLWVRGYMAAWDPASAETHCHHGFRDVWQLWILTLAGRLGFKPFRVYVDLVF